MNQSTPDRVLFFAKKDSFMIYFCIVGTYPFDIQRRKDDHNQK